MANIKFSFKDNVEGEFFVDEECIACDACVFSASNFFAMNSIEENAYVKTQPKTAEEKLLCENALLCCPVGAIGKREK